MHYTNLRDNVNDTFQIYNVFVDDVDLYSTSFCN